MFMEVYLVCHYKSTNNDGIYIVYVKIEWLDVQLVPQKTCTSFQK